MRRINDAGLELIKEFEKLRLDVYLDSAGLPTVGWGHLIVDGEDFPEGVTEEEADDLLQADLAEAEGCVEELVTVQLSDNQYGALVSFVFNVGRGSIKHETGFISSTLLRRLNNGDYDIGNEFGKWIKSGGKRTAGLVRRRAAERDLWETPDEA